MTTNGNLLTNQDCSSLDMHLTILTQIHLNVLLNVRTLLDYLDYEDAVENNIAEDFNVIVLDFSIYMHNVSVEDFSQSRRKLFQLWKHIEKQNNDLRTKVNSMCTLCKIGLKSPTKEMVDYLHQTITKSLSTFNDECQAIGEIIKNIR